MGLFSGWQSAGSSIAQIIAQLAGQTVSMLKLTLTQAAGQDALAISNNGARVHFGAGANDYASSDGTTVTFAGPVAVTSDISANGGAAGVLTTQGGFQMSTNKAIYLNGATQTKLIFWDGTRFNITGGGLLVDTGDSSGTPGNATINAPAGRSAIAAGTASVTITNSLAQAASKIFISPLARDATGLLPTVTTHGVGSFIVTTSGNCTAALSFDWWIVG